MTQQKTSKNKLTCTVTGLTVSVAPKVFDARATKFNSDPVVAESLLRSNYISALGRQLLRTGKTVEEIRAQYNVSVEVPLPSIEIVAKHIRWAKYRKPKTEQTTVEASNE